MHLTGLLAERFEQNSIVALLSAQFLGRLHEFAGKT
jgi:hypothetical protein